MPKEKLEDSFPAPFLDDEERELINSIESAWDESPPPPPDPAELERIQTYWQGVAAETRRKRRVTVRLQECDLRRLRVIAQEKGIPYQTLIGSILHQYVTGRMVEMDPSRP